MKKKTLWIEICAAALAFVLFVVICYAGGTALLPERATYGAGWKDFRDEQKDSVDVLILGSSRAYCNFIPGEIYRQSGLSAYVVAGPSQTLSLTRCYLQEALATQSPACVVLELSGLFYRRYEDFSLANAIYMPFSPNRVDAAFQCEPELRSSVLFPLEYTHHYLYEGRDAPTDEDRRMLCGYTPLRSAEAQTQTEIPSYRAARPDETAQNLEELDRIAALCRARDVRLVCVLAPSNWVYAAEDLDWLSSALSLRGIDPLLWQDRAEAFGIDAAQDWYDAIHLNVSGALKLSAGLAAYLAEQGVVPSGRCDAQLWEQRGLYFLDPSQPGGTS